MTKNQIHRYLSTQEEYAQSRHTGPDMNTNSEGYVESKPAINAPGDLAVSGYLDCHTLVCLYNLDCLGLEVADAVMQLVNEIFVNDVSEQQHGGKFCPVLFISTARLIGS